jgi:diguanylate cyclase (GGDEF)-like protein/PAS domain S-box-containing protein
MMKALASLFEQTPDAVVVCDERGIAARTNEAALTLTGFPESEIAGTPFASLCDPNDAGRIELALRTAFAGGTDHFDASVRHANGENVPVECYVFPARCEGAIVAAFVQIRDVTALRSAEESLMLDQERFRSLFEYHPDGIMELKETGTISRVNVALEDETGFLSEHLVGRPWTELVAPESSAAADGALARAMRGEAVELDAMLVDRLGTRVDVQLKLVPLRFGKEIRGAYAIFKNVTAQKAVERAIAMQSERIRRLYLVAAQSDALEAQIDATLQLGIELFEWDQGYVNQFDGERLIVRNATGTGIPKGTVYPLKVALSRHLLGTASQLYIADMHEAQWRDDPAAAAAMWRSYFGVRLTVFGEPYGSLTFASRVPRSGEIDQSERDLIHLMGLFVSAALERAAQNERIEQLAFNDTLTGLPNRALFNDRIEQAMASARRYNHRFAVMYLDIDTFKQVNDRYGHAVGDVVLKDVSQRFRSVIRESDTVSRIGGDEFVVLQPVVTGVADAADLARKLSTVMQEPLVLEGQRLDVRVSIGIALYPGDGKTTGELMEAADRALYRAKREGRNRWCFADQSITRRDLSQARDASP